MSYLENKKIAIVHEWFDKYAGSERVVEQVLNLYPQADLFALVDFLPETERTFIKNKPVKTTFIQRLPFAKKKFRNYLGLFPMAVEQIDLRGYDVIISSSHAVAKGVFTTAEQLHICYCHSPMRYAWDLYHQYLEEAGLTKGLRAGFVKWILHYLRMWDQMSSARVNYFIANSNFVAKRIQNIYGRTSKLVYPPVDTERFTHSGTGGDYYFSAARMVPYKKLELIISAFRKMPEKRLILAVTGANGKKIQALSGGNIKVLHQLNHDAFTDLLTGAKGFVYAAEEDFGIVMAEAQAAGVPVIAYQRGGAAEIVKDGLTGVFFGKQTEEEIIDAVRKFETMTFDSGRISAHADRFSVKAFKENFSNYAEECCEDFFKLNL
jgi:glycosyltransferase involved in cell wall biosynthesis